jgi:hypothetical protein
MAQFIAQLLRRSARHEWERLLLARRTIDDAMADARSKQDQAFAMDLERLRPVQG